ncbi:hypothetical protein ACFWA4_30790 [Streptomyces sp. NPDC060011]|jgi:hypothetical protein|uniref:hypothetical protein n=1 Tax=unclassified Streptomyces TaxID=2593676 RepID=UPI0009BDC308|nr:MULTISPECIES: hypothetical protein [unclassified Streptomyces]MCX4912445.1 hypothetical protein [Streptomyces sp. NBC_00687]MCX5136920.1 hypothetical protein [Streptomyces sp. NBC_00340]MCX5285131.1 hypothetical protein [Streptomyces sp. NBC_00198]NEB28861.1 hypothetical protein [Streptomyces sp. SID14446]OQQ14253.1 hypothetical protein B0675_29250 [Streptomyces sp. M41(2017)]
MSRAIVGMFVGMALAYAGYFGGFGAFLLVAALGAVGYGVGRYLEGGVRREDLRDLFERRNR